jgi:transposase
MSEITTLAIDLGKHLFQLHGVDTRGVAVQQLQLRRTRLLPHLAQTPPCEVVMEACAGSHYWARQIRAFWHKVRLIAPPYVKRSCGVRRMTAMTHRPLLVQPDTGYALCGNQKRRTASHPHSASLT